MQQLVIKIGADMKKDMKEVFENPSKARKNTHTLYLKDVMDLYDFLSPKRLELLRHIIRHQAERRTIGELALELKRKQEAISRDANLLAKYNLIKKMKKGQLVYLKALYGSFEIRLAGN